MDQITLQQLLRGNHKALLLVINALPFPIYYKDKNGLYLGCNKAYEEYASVKREEIIGKNVFSIFEDEAASIFDQSDRELINNPGEQIYETHVSRSGQETQYVKFHKATFFDENNQVAGILGAIIDITEQKQLEAKLKHFASYDDLTGIYNRREGNRQLKKRVQHAHRKNSALTVMLIDLDNFKSINDTFGHETGDNILIATAACLADNSRANDILCRYGGEEFLIILPETDTQAALTIAERHRKALTKISVPLAGAKNLHITASFGISEMGSDESERALMKHADIALYKAKHQGKNRVCS
jgi:diguanylate cyclase (GGDEF)-like protein/PAS domain S-box-containing protein